jgi:hypothetical protein
MAVEKVYLVIGADRRVRAARRPQIRTDEVAIAINLRFPDNWGRVVGTLDASVPDFTPEIEESDDDAYEVTS